MMAIGRGLQEVATDWRWRCVVTRKAGQTFALAVLLALTAAGGAEAWSLRPPAARAVVDVDWQDPRFLPRRFRNHCAFDAYRRRPYCANHCGAGYQFYYCSRVSFGCCQVGFGYCDRAAKLRCAP